jgi:hypothetical protein
MKLISSRDNPQLKAWRRLAQDSTAYRKAGQFWLEGDHLCRAALERGVRPLQVVLTESFQAEQGEKWLGLTDQLFVVPDALFASLSGLESPARMGFVVAGKQIMRCCQMPPPWCWTDCRTRVMWGPSCAVPRLLVTARCWPSRARRPCGRPRCCARAWGRILA